jgi:hypothetical protein
MPSLLTVFLWTLSFPVPIETGHPPVPVRLDLSRAVARAAATATTPDSANAPRSPRATSSGREFFVSWGYNGDRYAKSDIHFSQPSLGNDFTLHSVQARDSKTWTRTDVFHHSLFVPQYNFRFGMFFNEKWGGEVALDHIKWIVVQDQQVRLTGTLNGAPVDSDITLTPDVLRYQLNNGANPIFFNVIRRISLAGTPGKAGHIQFLGKAGIGFAIPHTQNAVFDQPNDAGFQPFHGWNMDIVAAVRINLLSRLYFEFEEKGLFASYHGVKINQGTASNTVKASEFVFHFGVSFPR